MSLINEQNFAKRLPLPESLPHPHYSETLSLSYRQEPAEDRPASKIEDLAPRGAGEGTPSFQKVYRQLS